MQDVTIERRQDNALLVRWSGPDAPEKVVVSTSPHEPDSLDDVEIELLGGRAIIPLEDHHPARVYVHLFAGDGEHVVVAERLVPLEGPPNFREIGGYETLDGRRVAWGKVFRSDGLATLTESDLSVLAELGVRLVCDFRRPHEEASAPSRIVDGGPIDRLWVPIGDGSDERKQIWDRIVEGSITSIGVEEMSAYYMLTLDQFAPVFGEVMAHIADPAKHAVVFHCTAGKDRTGMLAALLLSLLGVDEQTILHDYALTNDFRSNRRQEVIDDLARKGVDFESFLPFFTALPEVMANALGFIRVRWGSVDSYLTGPAAVDPSTLEALRHHLLA